MLPKLYVEVEEDYIAIMDYDQQEYEDQELVRWVNDEWEEDPSIVPAIANAIKAAYEDPWKVIRIARKEHNYE